MAKNKQFPTIRILKVKKGATLKTIFAEAHRAFTAANLEKFAETDEGLPARQLLADLEARDKEEREKRKRKSKNGRAR